MTADYRPLRRLAHLVRTGNVDAATGKLRLGVDLGTANLVLVVVDGRGGDACRGQFARRCMAGIGGAHRTVGGCLGEGRGTAQEQRKGKTMATQHGGPRGQAGCQRTSIRLRPLCLAAYRASSARRTRVS